MPPNKPLSSTGQLSGIKQVSKLIRNRYVAWVEHRLVISTTENKLYIYKFVFFVSLALRNCLCSPAMLSN